MTSMLDDMPAEWKQTISIFGKIAGSSSVPGQVIYTQGVVGTVIGNLQPSSGGSLQEFSDATKATAKSVLYCYPNSHLKASCEVAAAGKRYIVTELNDWAALGNYYALALKDA